MIRLLTLKILKNYMQEQNPENGSSLFKEIIMILEVMLSKKIYYNISKMSEIYNRLANLIIQAAANIFRVLLKLLMIFQARHYKQVNRQIMEGLRCLKIKRQKKFKLPKNKN